MMDFHLSRSLRFKPSHEIQYPSLYGAALVELDAKGRQHGPDLIPWRWTTHFAAVDVSLSDSASFDARGHDGKTESSTRRLIKAKLTPGDPRKSGGREPSYSMFGTDRLIEEIFLDIAPNDQGGDAGCHAWGSVGYTTDIDFRKETWPDVLQFYFHVQPAIFDRYAWSFAQGMVNEVVLAVGAVDGFYAEWSPEISTRNVKVLAGSEHVVAGAENIELRRLGAVGQAELFLNARQVLGFPKDQR